MTSFSVASIRPYLKYFQRPYSMKLSSESLIELWALRLYDLLESANWFFSSGWTSRPNSSLLSFFSSSISLHTWLFESTFIELCLAGKTSTLTSGCLSSFISKALATTLSSFSASKSGSAYRSSASDSSSSSTITLRLSQYRKQ